MTLNAIKLLVPTIKFLRLFLLKRKSKKMEIMKMKKIIVSNKKMNKKIRTGKNKVMMVMMIFKIPKIGMISGKLNKECMIYLLTKEMMRIKGADMITLNETSIDQMKIETAMTIEKTIKIIIEMIDK